MPQVSPDFISSPDFSLPDFVSSDFSSLSDFAADDDLRAEESDNRTIDYEALADALAPLISAMIEREVRQRSML